MSEIQHSLTDYPKPDLPFFFILGRPRSGTTLLSIMLDAHPHILLPFECAMIINLYPKYHKISLWNQKTLLALYADITSQRKFDFWRVETTALKQELLAFEGKFSFQSIIKSVYLHYQSFYQKGQIKLIGDKNPIYSIYPERLRKLFPDAKFIHLVRDYRDQIMSMQKVDFEAPLIALQAWRWRFATKGITRLGRHFPGSYYKLNYESLVSNPEKEIRSLCSFMEIEFRGEMLDFQKAKEKIFREYGEEAIMKYHKSLLKPVDSSKIEQWRTKMRPNDIRKADMIVGKYGGLVGYEKMYKNFSLMRYLCLLPMILYGILSFRLRFTTDHLPHKIKLYIRNKGPILAYLFNQMFNKRK